MELTKKLDVMSNDFGQIMLIGRKKSGLFFIFSIAFLSFQIFLLGPSNFSCFDFMAPFNFQNIFQISKYANHGRIATLSNEKIKTKIVYSPS